MSKEGPTENSSSVSFKQSIEDKWFALENLGNIRDADETTLIQMADIQRDLASCTFHESIKLNHSSSTTCHLLHKDLHKYEQIVHRSGRDPPQKGTSNKTSHLFMNDCLLMLDKYRPDGSYMKLREKSWDVKPDTDILNSYLLPCHGKFLGCSKDEISDNCAKQIFGNNFNSNNNQNNREANGPRPDVAGPSLGFENKNTVTAIKQSNLVPNVVSINKEHFERQFPVAKEPKEPSIISRNKWSAFEKSRSQGENEICDENYPETSQIEPIIKPKLKRRLVVESDLETTDTFAAAAPETINPFKTGREIFHQQMNMKTSGGNHPSQTAPTESTYQKPATVIQHPVVVSGVCKKSLGGRRNVQSKFVPPFLKQQPDVVVNALDPKGDDVEMVDERLKQIDPKMIEQIKNEIMDTSSSRVDWSDIAGLDYAKATIKEAVVWPLLRPDIFTGLRRPPRGILLFGPPGTGKTLIGKCIASQSKSTFFCISASSLTSKWIGDGEKMVRALFAVAAVHQPAVVFIDEIDSLLCQRSDTEHESSRRLKTEFLVQLDGAATTDDERILIVGATNRPQELDEAARRRLVKRLYIPLPELDARVQILKNLLGKERTTISECDINTLGRLTNGFSGADMKTLCHEASMGPIRSISMDDMEHIDLNDVRPVCYADFEAALKRVRSSVSPDDLSQYLRWDRTYGSGSGVNDL